MHAPGIGTLMRVSMMTVISMIAISGARAASVEKLLMPGPVAHAHEKQEPDCANCHDRSNRRSQSELCMDCHKDVASDVRSGHGYHGRMSNAGAGECRACHTEHKGRAADIVQLDGAHFDHQLTEFALQGAHAELPCESCHRPQATWRAAAVTCAG